MLKFLLNNGMEIEANDGSTPFDIIVDANQYEMMWENLTDENLKHVKLMTESGDLLDDLSNLLLEHEFSIKEKNEVSCHFYLRKKTLEEIEIENLRNQIASLTEQMTVHDGAINDLGEAVSVIAEEGGIA